MDRKILKRVLQVATLLIAATPLTSHALGDSSTIRSMLDIPKAPQNSIIGQATDDKTCRYKSTDGKIHCTYGSGGNAEEYVADSTSTPSFPAFGSFRMGHVSLEEGARYTFLNAESPSPVSGRVAVRYCRLALQFLTSDDEIVWIWHDELRYDGSGQVAVVDSDGDGYGDLPVTGEWNGNLYGSSRWWTPNPYESSYSAEERAYPPRPTFGRINGAGKSRSCVPDSVKVVKLVPVSTRTGPSVNGAIDVWSSTTRP